MKTKRNILCFDNDCKTARENFARACARNSYFIMSYFAVSLPPSEYNSSGDQIDSNPTNRVFQSREEALKAFKSFKNSRLKTFSTEEEAVKFACDIIEAPQVR